MGRSYYVLKVIAFTLLFSLCILPLATFARTAAEELQSVRQLIEQYYVDPVPSEILQKGSIHEILTELDPYTEYMTREEYQQFIDGLDQRFSGIGVQVERVENGLAIITVFDESPAQKAGIQAGDIITNVDGTSIETLALEVAISLVRGEPGTKVQLTLYRPATSEYLEMNVLREAIEIPIVHTEKMAGNIGYIQLYSFGDQTSQLIQKAIKELGEVNGYIFDLRFNGGGYVEAAREVLGFFPNVSDALKVEYNHNRIARFTAIRQKTTFEKPVTLLVNAYSASASEIVAATLKDYEAAKIYGQTTFGKGTMQNLIPTNQADPNNSNLLKLTIARFYSPLENKIDTIGVKPHVETEEGQEFARAHQDFLHDVFKDYKNIRNLKDVPEEKTFTVTFSAPVDWSSVDDTSFELVSPGNSSLAFTYESLSATELVIKPAKPLESGEDYYLYVHPGLKGETGKTLKKGAYISLQVK